MQIKNLTYLYEYFFFHADEEEQREFAAAAVATNSLCVTEPTPRHHNRNSITSIQTRSTEVGSRYDSISVPYSQELCHYKAKLLLEATFFIIIFTIPEVDIQVQNSQGVLGNLVICVLDMGLAC